MQIKLKEKLGFSYNVGSGYVLSTFLGALVQKVLRAWLLSGLSGQVRFGTKALEVLLYFAGSHPSNLAKAELVKFPNDWR